MGRIRLHLRSWNKHDIMAHPWSLAAHCDQQAKQIGIPYKDCSRIPGWVPFLTTLLPLCTLIQP